MNRPHHRQVLECAGPLALSATYDFQSARGLAHSKTLPRFIVRQSDPAVQGFKARNCIWRNLTLTPSEGEWEATPEMSSIPRTWQ